MSNEGTSAFTLVGAIVAGILSFGKWGSVILALLHGAFLGWIYVIYFLIRYGVHNLRY